MIYKDFNEKFLAVNSLNEEEWRDVDGWGGKYMVSNIGRVYSKRRMRTTRVFKMEVGGIILKNITTKAGYQVVPLHNDGKRCLAKVHRLVATAFIPIVDGMNIINHKDGDKSNNLVANLEWCNQLHNNIHALKTGLRVNAHGEKASQCLYSDKLILETIDLHNSGFDVRHISLKTGIPCSHIRKVIKRQTRTHLTNNIFIKTH